MSEEPLEQMKSDFVAESLEAVQKLSQELSGLDPAEADSEELVNTLFRKAHSLKGTAGMFELLDIGNVAAAMENVLEELRSGGRALNHEVIDIILEGLDEIVLLFREARGEDVETGPGGVIGRIAGFLGGGKEKEEPDPLAAIRARMPEGSLEQLMPWEADEILECLRSGKRVVYLTIDLGERSFTEVASEVLPDLAKYGKVLGVPPPPEGARGKALALIFSVEADPGAFDHYVAGRCGRLVEAAAAGEGGAGSGASPEPDAREARAGRKARGKSSAAMSVKVDLSRLDAVMNSISELYSVRFKLSEVARTLAASITGRKERDELMKLGLLLTRRITEIETAVLEARLVPVSMLFNRYTGEIRRLARKQGKRIDLKLEGEGTRMDRALLEEIYDPVLHLIRNAVDHGIEPEDERLRRGKPAGGHITLRARQESNYVRIDIEDDGGGFDFEKIERIARAKGVADFSEDDLVSLLFEPGVSTSAEVTEISGRGVGLDEVKVRVESLRGMVNVESQAGRGTCFSLLVPLTLAVSRGVVFEEGDITAVLPLTYVEEIIPYRGKLKREIEEAGAARTIRHGRVEAFDLADLLGYGRDGPPRSIVIVGFGDVRHAMTVGRVWGETDIATRPLPETMQAPPVIAGATELHDRRPAVIVQPEPLFRTKAHAFGAGGKRRDTCPPDVGLGAVETGRSFCRMGLFETAGGLTAVPLSLLNQVIPMRPLVGLPLLRETWEGIFFERGLCHGLLRVGNGNGAGEAGAGGAKIALLKFPERCAVGVSGVIGEIEVPVEKLESVKEEGPLAPVRRAARFELDGASVDVLDVNRVGAETAGS